jgi:CheY-like chemotaxis protein
LSDDREEIKQGDRVLLIIEDDPKFARILYDFARGREFKCLLAGSGEEGLQLVREYGVTAVLLDLQLPGINGWDVLRELKSAPETRHIPVHMTSVLEESLEAYKQGALGYLHKPASPDSIDAAFTTLDSFISKDVKSLLIVEDDAVTRMSLRKLIGGDDIALFEAEDGAAALQLLRREPIDCVILDLNLPDMTGFALLDTLEGETAVRKPPVIVYTGRELTREENNRLLQYADTVIVKGVKSEERLLDETALFLHRVVAELPQSKQSMIRRLHDSSAQLADKKILLVDDDMRNAFALSKLLSERGMQVELAADGQKALDILAAQSDIDLVLMDVMMPVMDGYEAIQRIRAQPQFHALPILALTAKAMRGDREKCLQAGANDYLAKPVDVDRLLSMLQVWLSG